MHSVMQKIYRLTSWLALGLKGDSQKQTREHFDGINCCQSEWNLLHSPSTDSTDSAGCSRLCSSTSVVWTRPAASASLARICSGPSERCNDNPRPVICRGWEVSQAEPRPVFAARCVHLAWHSSSTSTSALGVWSTLQLHHVAIISASQRRWLKLKGFTPIICRRMRRRQAATFSESRGFFFFFTTWLFLTLSSVIADILFFRFMSAPFGAAPSYDDTLRFTRPLIFSETGPLWCTSSNLSLSDRFFQRCRRGQSMSDLESSGKLHSRETPRGLRYTNTTHDRISTSDRIA